MGEKILLIDSTRLLSDDLCRSLESKGYELSVVRSSKQLNLYNLTVLTVRFETCSSRFKRVQG